MSSTPRAAKRRKLDTDSVTPTSAAPSSTRRSARRSQAETNTNDAVETPSKSSRSKPAQAEVAIVQSEPATRSSSRKKQATRKAQEPQTNGVAKANAKKEGASSSRTPTRARRKGKAAPKQEKPAQSPAINAEEEDESDDTVGRDSDHAEDDLDELGHDTATGQQLDLDESPDAEAEDVQDDTVPSIHAPPDLTATATLDPSIQQTSEEYYVPRSIALEKLSGRRPIPLYGLNSQIDQVHQLLSSTVTAGQGNSLLLLGSRGTGKSAVVEHVLSALEADALHIAQDGRPNFHTIRLNGFVQTDDKLALREIWRQLGREMEVEEEDGKGMNYADTLAKLLALLSHPAELAAQLQGQGQMDVDGQPAAAQPHEQVSNAVIFLMSEFDAFAARPRQTLLYNLFDIAQSRKAPIAVIGMSTRMDVSEMLEKRVKSRFSHRYIHIPPAKTLDEFVETCKGAVQVHELETNFPEKQQLSYQPSYILDRWNSAMDNSFDVKGDNTLREQIEQVYYTSRSIPTALSLLYLAVATADPSTHASGINSISLPAPVAPLSSAKLTHISSLPSLSLALLIAAARLPLLTGSDTVSFPLAYDEYRALATKARLAASSGGAQVHGGVAGRVWGKDVAKGAWEGLIDAGLVMTEDSNGVGGIGMCRVDVALEEIEPSLGKGMEKALVRWCREL